MPLMSKIVAADLVDRVNGKYSLLALGEVVNNSLGLIENGLDIYWKLKTNDAFTKGTNIPRAKHRHLVDTSVENGQIKEILVKGLSV